MRAAWRAAVLPAAARACGGKQGFRNAGTPTAARAVLHLVLCPCALSPSALHPIPPHPVVHCSLTGLLEASGYAALIYAIEKSGQSSIFNAYVAMQVLVVLSPNVIQAAMYWCVAPAWLVLWLLGAWTSACACPCGLHTASNPAGPLCGRHVPCACSCPVCHVWASQRR